MGDGLKRARDAARATRQPAKKITYDVTAVSHDDQYVPLAAGTDYPTAHEIARPRSMDEAWARVQIRVAETREIIATYIDGADLENSR
jgi:hypothetical protein